MKVRPILILIFIALLQCSLNACDLIKITVTSQETIETYNEGAKLFAQNKYQEAYPIILKAAEKGYAPAQNDVGWMNLNGLGVPQDPSKGIEWLRKAADQKNYAAYNNIGVAYLKGLGVKQDDAEAEKWFIKSAEKGDDMALYNLGYLYERGSSNVPKNTDKALDYFKKAADKGNGDAMNEIGYMYKEGNGVPKDSQQAIMWLEKSAAHKSDLGQTNLGIMYYLGDGVEKNPDKAFELLQKAASQGQSVAQYFLAGIYNDRKDYEKMVEWLLKSAQQNYPPALYAYGSLLISGDSVPQNVEEGKKYQQRAKNLGYQEK